MHSIPSSLWILVFPSLISAQNFQWSNPSGDTRPWPFGSGGSGAPQQQQQPVLQVQVQQQPPPQSRQPWQIIPDQGRPINNPQGVQVVAGSGSGPVSGSGQPVFIVSPNQPGSQIVQSGPSGPTIVQSGSPQNPVWNPPGSQNPQVQSVVGQPQPGQLVLPVQVQQGQIWQPHSGSSGQSQSGTGTAPLIVVGSGPAPGQIWAAAGANPPAAGQVFFPQQQPNQPQWFGDPNRPPDAQIFPNQPVGPSIHTTADKTVILNAAPYNVPQPAAFANQPLWNAGQPPQQPPLWQSGQPAGSISVGSQGLQAWWQQQQQNPPPAGQQPAGWSPWQGQQIQQQQQQQPGATVPLWVPGQQGWITNAPSFEST